MTIDSQQENEIVSRWKNGQSMRAIARDMVLGRAVISRVIAEHQVRTRSTSTGSSAILIPSQSSIAKP